MWLPLPGRPPATPGRFSLCHDAMIWFAWGMVCGTWALHSLPGLPDMQQLALLLAGGMALLLSQWLGTWRLLAAGLAVGAAWGGLQAHRYQDTRLAVARQRITLVGQVVSLPAQRQGSFTFDMAVQRVLAGPWQPKSSTFVRLWWWQPPGTGAPQPGSCWQVQATLRAPHALRNPGLADASKLTEAQHIAAIGSVRPGEGTHVLAHCQAMRPGLALRAALSRRLDGVLPATAGGGIVRALAIGDQGRLDAAAFNVLNNLDLSHLIAISGQNVAMVAAVFFFVARFVMSRFHRLTMLLPAQRWAAWITMPATAVYGALAGWSIPTRRAVVMALALLLMLGMGRGVRPGRILALAAIMVLLLDPAAVRMPGFALSFAAVALLGYGVAGRVQRAGHVHALLRDQVVVALGLAPVAAWLLGRLSLLGAPLNLIAVPVCSLLLAPLALVGTLALGLDVPGSGWVLRILARGVDWVWPWLDWLARQPWGIWPMPQPPVWAVLLAGLGCLLALAPRGIPLRSFAVVLLAPLLFTQREAPPAPGDMRMTVLDVGQGLAVLVETAGHRLLYDTGPASLTGSDAGARVVVPYLRSRGIGSLDGVVLSHDDRDHSGGLAAVMQAMQPAWVLLGEPHAGLANGIPCRIGMHWWWDGVHFAVLHPPPGRSGNAASCVILMESAGRRLLLPGDLEGADLDDLALTFGASPRLDVLVAPHHGAKKGATAAWVAVARPRWVLYSAGFGNAYGHPAAQVVQSYAAQGSMQRATACSGALVVNLQQGHLAVSATRREDQASCLLPVPALPKVASPKG